MGNVLIVGGTRGIGKVIAQTLEARGDKITVVGRKSNPNMPEFGTLTNLICSQRYRGMGNTWSGEIDTSLTLTNRLILRCAEWFDGDPANCIVIMSSVIATSVADEQPLSYHVAKSGLEAMVRWYAVNLGKRGIRVNGVAPGVVLKPENEAYYRDHPEKVEMFQRINPLGRMVTAQEIAHVVAFLCSPNASAINGQIITVDGGVSLLNPESLARSLLE